MGCVNNAKQAHILATYQQYILLSASPVAQIRILSKEVRQSCNVCAWLDTWETLEANVKCVVQDFSVLGDLRCWNAAPIHGQRKGQDK
jgi:hypothetical protein